MDAKKEILEYLFGDEDVNKLDRTQYDYVDELCSIGVHNLEKESNRLIEEKTKIEQALKDEAVKNFQKFVETSEFTSNLVQEFEIIENKAGYFVDDLPILKKRVDDFSHEATDITKRWRTASLMLSKHNQLLEFLEIPQMVETCIRNNHYEEALKLFSRVNKINRKDILLVQKICKELEKSRDIMINQLLKELYQGLELSNAIKIVGYLRALNAFTETEMRIKFLNARDSWLKSLTKELPSNNSLDFILKLTDVYRVNLFEIVTQYRAVFPDEATSPNLNLDSDDDKDFSDSSILSSWISYKINDFLFKLEETLEKYLMHDISSIYPLENIFEACFYFGISMSKIGADFRPLLAYIIERITLVRFSQLVDKALTRFGAKMESYNLPIISLTSESLDEAVVDQKDDFDPPEELLNYIPLAHLCNDLISALNKVSKVVPLALVVKFTDILNSRLRQASDILAGFITIESDPEDTDKIASARRMIDVYFYNLVPHIQRCLTLLSPLPQVTKVFGLSVVEYNRMKKNSKELAIHDLDMDRIKEPILDFLDSSQLIM